MERKKIILKCGHTDVRRGIDGLAGVLIEGLELEPFDKEGNVHLLWTKKRSV